MELFDVIDRENGIFSLIQDEVCVEDFDVGPCERIVICGVNWDPPKMVLSFAEKYALFCERRVISCYCMCCWTSIDCVPDSLLCDVCGKTMTIKERRHATRVMLIREMDVCRDMAGVITAAYCASVAGELDGDSRKWTEYLVGSSDEGWDWSD
jgi:hypothetical protein